MKKLILCLAVFCLSEGVSRGADAVDTAIVFQTEATAIAVPETQALSPAQEKKLFNDFLTAVYAQREGDPQALMYLEKALADDPGSKYLKRMLVLQALADNKVDVADQYADFIDQGENDAEDWSVYGAYQWKKGDVLQAQESYQKAMAFDPDDLQQAYPYLLLLAATDPARAIALLEDIAQRQPSVAGSAYAEAGNLLLRRRDLKSAFAYFEKALALDPEDINARLGKAEVYERSSQFFLMLHELEELEKMGFGNASTYSRMASVFVLGKDIEKAKQYFLKAKASQNDDIPSAYFLALLSEQEGNFESAVAYLKDAADFDQDPSKWLQVSFYQQKLNQFEPSAATLAQAHQKFPDNVEIAFFYGLALQQIKQYKKAAQVYKELTAARPEYTEAWLQYAYALESLKKYKEMEDAVRRILELKNDHAPALNLLAYSLAVRNVRLDEAQEYISRALAVSPQDLAFIDTQAWIYFQQGKSDQAAQLLGTIPGEVVDKNPEMAFHLGAVFAAQGQTQQALPYLEKARTEIPEADRLYRRLQKHR